MVSNWDRSAFGTAWGETRASKGAASVGVSDPHFSSFRGNFWRRLKSKEGVWATFEGQSFPVFTAGKDWWRRLEESGPQIFHRIYGVLVR
jgi:hypothetical protein